MPALHRRTAVACLPVLLAGAGLLALADPVRSEEITLKAAVFVPPTTTYGIPFKRFVDRVNETGKGVLQIRIVGGPEAVPADGQAQAVKNGVLDHRVDPAGLLQERDGRGRRAGALRHDASPSSASPAPMRC